MRALLGALASGLLFGAGLAVSGLVDPLRVLGFLDVAGAWDATLLFVMGGAIVAAAPAYALARRRAKPLAAARFHFPEAGVIDKPLLIGAAIFGVGWGLAGYCPGPAIAGLGVMWHELLWFVPAYAAGAWIGGFTKRS